MSSLKRSASPPVDSDDGEDSVISYTLRSSITPSSHSRGTRRNASVAKPAAALGLGKGPKLAERKGAAAAKGKTAKGKVVTSRDAPKPKPVSKVVRATAPPTKRAKKVEEVEEEVEGARRSRRSSGKKPEVEVLLDGAPEAADDFWDEKKAVGGKRKRGRPVLSESEEEEDEEEPVARPVKASRPSPKKAPTPAPTVDSDSDSDEAIVAQLTLASTTLPSPISTPLKPLPQLEATATPISTPSRATPILASSSPRQPRPIATSISPSSSPPQSRYKGITFFASTSPPQSRASASPPISTPTKAPVAPVASTSKATLPPSPATSSPSRTPIKATRVPIASTSKAPPPPSPDASEDEASDEEDPMSLVPSPTKSSPSESSILPSPTKTPIGRARSTSTSTPTTIRQSARARKLPIAQADIASMPLSLQSDLVGWHGDYESDVSSDEEVQVSPSRAGTSKGRPTIVHSRMYPAKSLYRMLGHIGAVVNGHRVPSVLWPEKPFDQTKVASWPCVQHMDEWEKPMRYAMESTVKDGVGNCLIVLGPRGVGKTMIVKRSIIVLEQVYGKKSFIVVKLNGLVQTTDRAAMRSIARQLKSQGFEDDDGDFGSNAATMATLLRMLEPSDDPTAVAEKPIIIVLDELDLFAQHPRQSFLYCLFDIVQGNRRKAGLAVIGISARTDCLSILEKRVRSRCQSHVLQMVRENSWDEYMDMARSLLRLDERMWRSMSDEYRDMAIEWNLEVEAFLQDPPVVAFFDRLWKIHGNTPTYLRQAIAELYATTEYWTSHTSWTLGCPAPDFVKIPTLDVKLLGPQDEPGKRNDLMGDCSILELAIIIAGKHLRVDRDNMMNLEMLYDCYLQHTKRNKSSGPSAFPFTKSQFCMGLDQLREREVFIPYVGRPTNFISPSCANTFKFYKLVPWASTIDDETNTRSDVPQPLKRWNKNSLA